VAKKENERKKKRGRCNGQEKKIKIAYRSWKKKA